MNSYQDELYKWKLESETHRKRTLILKTYSCMSSWEETNLTNNRKISANIEQMNFSDSLAIK